MITKLVIQTKLALMDFYNDQRGVTAVEYAIIAVAISTIVLAAFNTDLGTALDAAMDRVVENVTPAAAAASGGGAGAGAGS